MDFLTLYHNNYEFKKQFQSILRYELMNIKKDFLKINICGAPRTRNRGFCRRQSSSGTFCSYHLNKKNDQLPDNMVYMEKYKKNTPTARLEIVNEEDNPYLYKNNIYDFFDKEKINNDNILITEKKLKTIIIKDLFFDNSPKSSIPRLICYYNDNISSSLPFTINPKKKKKKKKKNKKNKKRKRNNDIIDNIKQIKENYSKLLDLNKKIKIYIFKNSSLNELDKTLLNGFIDELTKRLNFNENTENEDIKMLSENIYIKLNKYLDLQIEKNNKRACLYIKSVFNLYNQIFDENFKEDYETDPIHLLC